MKKIFSTVKCYYRHLLGRHIWVRLWKIRLWHLGITTTNLWELDEALKLEDSIADDRTALWLGRAWRNHLERPPDKKMYWNQSYVDPNDKKQHYKCWCQIYSRSVSKREERTSRCFCEVGNIDICSYRGNGCTFKAMTQQISVQ